MVKKVIKKGSEVLIFNYIPSWGPKQDTKHYIKGIVTNIEMSEYIPMHGTPKNVISYTVLGEDGNEYFGNYGSHVLGDSFFMTKEDYADMLVQKNISSESKAYMINRRTR